jgi:hypothetical protein
MAIREKMLTLSGEDAQERVRKKNKRKRLWVSVKGADAGQSETSNGKGVGSLGRRSRGGSGPHLPQRLSLAKLDRQLALGWLDVLQLVLSLTADYILQPRGLVIFGLGGDIHGSWTAVSPY